MYKTISKDLTLGKKMNLKNKLDIICSLFKVYSLKKRVPFAVSWMLTNRCNRKCSYCDLPRIKCKELTTKQIFSIIDELKEMGCQRIGFTGGEPLLKENVGEIIDHCVDKGIFTGLVSNGALVPEKIDEIKNLDLLQLSIDGSEEVNDKQRYKGSYKEVVKAIETAKDYHLKVWLTSVLTKHNIGYIDSVIKLAEDFDIKVFFQPVVSYKNCGDVGYLFPAELDYKKTMSYLIRTKSKIIANSNSGLKYLYHWPQSQSMKCFAGRLLAHIYTNGDVYPCFNMDGKRPINCLDMTFKKAFSSLSLPTCNSCWTYANIEFNHLFSLKFDTILNTFRILSSKNFKGISREGV